MHCFLDLLEYLSRLRKEVQKKCTQNVYHRQQNKWYLKRAKLSEKLLITAALCNEI